MLHTKNRKHALLFIPGFILILLSAICWYFNLYINLTPSMPLGIWHAKSISSPLTRGSFISFCLRDQPELLSGNYFPKGTCPNGFAPLLKSIIGIKGDVIDITQNYVAINGIHLEHSVMLQKDTQNRHLPHTSYGRYILKQDEYFVLATHHPNSLDSRYFGPIHKNDILHVMEPIWVYKYNQIHPTGI